MKNIIPFITSNNKYLYVYSTKQFYVVNNFIYNFFFNLNYKDFSIEKLTRCNCSDKDKRFIREIIEQNGLIWKPTFNTYFSKNEIKKNFYVDPDIVFEVTEKCNLDCKYCTYGTLYNNYDKRSRKNFDIDKAKFFIDFVINNPLFFLSTKITIGFYGGEPLLNFNFIKEITAYCKNKIKDKKLIFTLTTNGTLLHKYIDFLVENNFEIAISLDGNKENNSYRIFKNGHESFTTVYNNINLLKERYPNFFKNNVSFQSVLHNKNSVEEIQNFFYENYKKYAEISELAENGIVPEKLHVFRKMFKTYEIKDKNFHRKILKYNMEYAPEFLLLALFISNLTILKNQEIEKIYHLKDVNKIYIPTATCVPFQKRIFVTCNYKILACERIDHRYELGKITPNDVKIDFEKISIFHKKSLDNIAKLCSKCFKVNSCENCVYSMQRDNKGNFICEEYMNEENFKKNLSEMFSFIEQNNAIISKIYETEIE